jgi:hypothetical protein
LDFQRPTPSKGYPIIIGWEGSGTEVDDGESWGDVVWPDEHVQPHVAGRRVRVYLAFVHGGGYRAFAAMSFAASPQPEDRHKSVGYAVTYIRAH